MSFTESDNFAMLMTPYYCKINLAENKILRGPAKNLRGPVLGPRTSGWETLVYTIKKTNYGFQILRKFKKRFGKSY